MKKILSVLLIVAMVFCFAACGGGEDAQSGGEDTPVTLVIGNVAPGMDHPYNQGLTYAQEYLEEHNSTVSLDFQINSILGSETEQCSAVAVGDQDMVQLADMSATNIIPQLAFANFPGIMNNYDEVLEAWGEGGWAYEIAEELFAEKGMTLLGAMDNGFRWISNSKRPITCVDDIKGLTIRVPEVELLLDIWDKFGALTVPIAYSELTTALQTGTVDGQELGISSFYQNRWDEYNQYVTQINYDYSAALIAINTEKFNSLSEKQQQDLRDAFNYACPAQIEYCAEFNANGLQTMLDEGLNETPMTDEFREEIYQIGYELAHTDKWMGILGEDIVNKIYPAQ